MAYMKIKKSHYCNVVYITFLIHYSGNNYRRKLFAVQPKLALAITSPAALITLVKIQALTLKNTLAYFTSR
jgi:hypothetical protein